MNKNIVTVLGAGAWGTAFANLIAHNGYHVKLWCYEDDLVDIMCKTGFNERYLPNIALSSLVYPTHSLSRALSQSSIVFQAIPVCHLRTLLTTARLVASSEIPWVSLSKGIENGTGFLATEIIDHIIKPTTTVSVISGPSYAQYLNMPGYTGMVLGSFDQDNAMMIRRYVENEHVFLIESRDVGGIQYAGAFKNIIALAMGIFDSYGINDNTRAVLFQYGLHELQVLLRMYGYNSQTAYSLCGLGDILLSSYGALSKNKQCGRLIAQHYSIAMLKDHFKQLPEGLNTLQTLCAIIPDIKTIMPFSYGIHALLYEGRTIDWYIDMIISRSRGVMSEVLPIIEPVVFCEDQ